MTTFPKTRLLIEIKQQEPSLVERMLNLVDTHRRRRTVMVVSEHQKPLDQIRLIAPEIPTNFAYHEIAAFVTAMATNDLSYRPPGDAIQLPPEYYSWNFAQPETVEMAHRHGIEVHFWTINEEPQMRALLDLGVDGIVTDFPARALELINSRLV